MSSNTQVNPNAISSDHSSLRASFSQTVHNESSLQGRKVKSFTDYLTLDNFVRAQNGVAAAANFALIYFDPQNSANYIRDGLTFTYQAAISYESPGYLHALGFGLNVYSIVSNIGDSSLTWENVPKFYAIANGVLLNSATNLCSLAGLAKYDASEVIEKKVMEAEKKAEKQKSQQETILASDSENDHNSDVESDSQPLDKPQLNDAENIALDDDNIDDADVGNDEQEMLLDNNSDNQNVEKDNNVNEDPKKITTKIVYIDEEGNETVRNVSIENDDAVALRNLLSDVNVKDQDNSDSSDSAVNNSQTFETLEKVYSHDSDSETDKKNEVSSDDKNIPQIIEELKKMDDENISSEAISNMEEFDAETPNLDAVIPNKVESDTETQSLSDNEILLLAETNS